MMGRVAVVCAALMMAMAPAGQQGQPRFRAVADEVLVDVSVRDGRLLVAGLTLDDFEVVDNGVVQSAQAVEVISGPIDVTLVVQHHAFRTFTGPWTGLGRDERPVRSLGRTSVDAGVAASADVVRALLRPGDRLDVLTADRGHVAGAATSVLPVTAARSSLPDEVTAAMMLGPSAPGRQRLIVAVTGAIDDRSAVPHVDRLAVANRTDAVVHAVSLGQEIPAVRTLRVGPSTGGVTPVALEGHAPRPLDAIVEATGGRMFRADSADAVTSQLTAAVDEFRTRYLLRYTPTGVPREGWHEIEVRVTSGDYDVRHRRGYEIVR